MFASNLILALNLGLHLAPVDAYFRMSCPGRLVRERLDPIISPGTVSGHVHTISGGSAFAADYTYADARAAKCSSCTIKEDMSNYWTPQLYVKNKDGTFSVVPSRGDDTDSTGGMAVYYFYEPESNVQPFPEGFRMLAGDPFKRNDTGDVAAKALKYYCDGSEPHLSEDTYGLPNSKCNGYLKVQFLMPSCWTGKKDEIAPPGGKGHVSYYDSDDPRSGKCPEAFPVRIPQLLYEVEYDTAKFNDQWEGDNHPFTFAQGDSTGFGFHGDFVNGWDVEVLGKAIKDCTSDPNGNIQSCNALSEYSWDECRACKLPSVVGDDVVGPMKKLLGCNLVTDGPEPAQSVKDCDDKGELGASEGNFVDLTASKKWEYTGCGSDDIGSRTFTGASTSGDDMTVEQCVDFCSDKGFSYAGLEYGQECYCDNELSADRAPKDGIYGECTMPCKGNAKEFCGNAAALSIYHKCDSTCQNQQVGGSDAPTASSSQTSSSSAAHTTLRTRTKRAFAPTSLAT